MDFENIVENLEIRSECQKVHQSRGFQILTAKIYFGNSFPLSSGTKDQIGFQTFTDLIDGSSSRLICFRTSKAKL